MILLSRIGTAESFLRSHPMRSCPSLLNHLVLISTEDTQGLHVTKNSLWSVERKGQRKPLLTDKIRHGSSKKHPQADPTRTPFLANIGLAGTGEGIRTLTQIAPFRLLACLPCRSKQLCAKSVFLGCFSSLNGTLHTHTHP